MRAYVEQIWDDCSKFIYFQYRDNHFLADLVDYYMKFSIILDEWDYREVLYLNLVYTVVNDVDLIL